ncbi:MAG: HlyD family efflux transporter periplasmic adaptor subunit [Desulfobulbaceae bacterium]|nr:HlyD family efflux transporter periplasmic adaptor subunit [Desulfobulbaceae bacterium]
MHLRSGEYESCFRHPLPGFILCRPRAKKEFFTDTMTTTPLTMRNSLSQFPLLLLVSACLILSGCREKQQNYYQGYVEGEFLHVSSPIGGRLEALAVSRGMSVAAGDALFTLDRTVEAAEVAEAEQGLQRAENQLADLTKGLRSSEIQAMEARREQARAVYDLAKIQYERSRQLLQQKAAARETLDRAKTEMERSAAEVAQLDAELETARLGARPDLIAAARTDVDAARQRLVQAQWRMDEKKLAAPQQALVFDTFYVEGEFVPAAYPVVSILPPGNITVRFFVPEPVVGTLKTGQKISINFDGAKKPYQAAVSYISPRAEYTPPVIYSRESRTHLVFMIEARVNADDATALHPGQPVDVRLEPPHG